MATLYKNIRIIDPKAQLDLCEDIYIDEDRIEISPSRMPASTIVIRGRGLIACPGLVDLHVHFREPGFLYKEDISSGIKAALAGGVTSALVMPNTNPTIDEAKGVYYQLKRAQSLGFDLMVAGAATRGLKGEELTDVGVLKRAGARAITDDGKVIKSEHMAAVLKACRRHNMLCMQHAEDCSMSADAPFHQGKASAFLGIKGQTSETEANIVKRDLDLALALGVRYHVLHLSCAQSVALLRRAKRETAVISAEASPHHLLLCDEDILHKDASKKMNPPLRSRADQEALLIGINDGTIDAVASDHAPHSAREKRNDLLRAPFGVVGVESSILVLLTLVKKQALSINKAIALMSAGPARVLQDEQRIGTLVGPLALKNMCVIDPNFRRVFSPRHLHGRSKNSAFIGREMFGRVMATFQNGRRVYKV